MDKKKHKRIEEAIMKPADLKKARMQRVGNAMPSSSSSGGIKAKLDFRTTTITAKPSSSAMTISGTTPLQNATTRPTLDDKWKDFGDTINLNVETFGKNIIEAAEQDKFNKVGRMIVAALKHFLANQGYMKVEYRILGSIAQVIKAHGEKLNHTAVHRGFLYILCYSRSFSSQLLQLFISITTCLAKKQQVLDKCYIAAFLHDAIGSSSGLGTLNKCFWIDKPFSEELVDLILRPFATNFPSPEVYASCQLDNFGPADYFPKFKPERTSELRVQLDVFGEFLKPWFDTVRGELIPKSVLRVLGLLCGFEQVRHFVATRLDVWINLQKFHREISELLLILGCNLDSSTELDREIVDILLKLNTKNMKTRTVSTPFSVAIRQACEKPVNVKAIFESVLVNELKQVHNRSPANLPTMHMLLGCQPVEATSTLANYCASELVQEKEICAKQLRGFLKELIRGFYHSKSGDFQFSVFADVFLERISNDLLENESTNDEAVPKMACDLLVQVPLATISSLMVTRDNAFSTRFNIPLPNGEFPWIPPECRLTREKFQKEFQSYCEVVLRWLSHESHMFSPEEFRIQSYYHLLFLDKQREVYTSMDSAAVQEADIPNLFRIFGECGVTEKMFMLIFGEAYCKLPHRVAIDIASSLTHRAAQYHLRFMETPLVELTDPFKLIERTLQISVYSVQEIPRTEEIPQICSKILYWNAWNLIMIWIAGGEIHKHFEKIYMNYSILRYMILVVMLRKFEFPIEFEGKNRKVLESEDKTLVLKDAQILSKVEKMLNRSAGSLVNTSYVFTSSECFRAPISFDDLRINSEKYRFASRLCRCDSPPLLPQMIASVGAKNSLPAVLEMLAVDASAVTLLTPDCLFHVLIHYHDKLKPWNTLNDLDRVKDQQAIGVLRALIRRTENALTSLSGSDSRLLHHLLASLSSPDQSHRDATVAVFAEIFSSKTQAFDITKLSKLARFEEKKVEYLQMIASALIVELDDKIENMYLEFLANSFAKESMHKVSRIVCHFVATDRFSLRNSLCEFFVNYVDHSIGMDKLENFKKVPPDLTILEVATAKIVIDKLVPASVIRLLAKYPPTSQNSDAKRSFESLIELWLSSGSLPKVIDRNTGKSGKFLTLAMRKQMLKSDDQRVVDAALDDMSEKDAQEFVLVSQMSNETAEKVISKAENMDVDKLEYSVLANIYLVTKAYGLKNVDCARRLSERVKNRLEFLKNQFSTKEEMMIVDESSMGIQRSPPPFVEKSIKPIYKSAVSQNTMTTSQITTWLKQNCASIPANKQQLKSNGFNPPPSFVQSALSNEQSANACLQHIEANLKYFLGNIPSFENLIMIVDTASYKFAIVQKRLETLAVRLLKSVHPPESVAGVLKKHAARNAANSQNLSEKNGKQAEVSDRLKEDWTHIENTLNIEHLVFLISQLVAELKNATDIIWKKRLISNFMEHCVHEKEEECSPDDILLFLNTLWEVYTDGDAEIIAEKCVSIDWNLRLKRIVCTSLLNHYQPSLPAIFVFHLLELYCRTYPIASYRELFLVNNCVKNKKMLPNRTAFQSLVFYFSDLAKSTSDYDLSIIGMITELVKEGSVLSSQCFGEYLLLTSCSHIDSSFRDAAKRLLDLIVDRLPYLSYQHGVAASMRVLSNVQTRESCIQKCELTVDCLIEMKANADLALDEDICEEEKVSLPDSKSGTKGEEDEKQSSGLKRGLDHRRGGPHNKKGKWVSAREAAIVGGVTVEETEETTAKYAGTSAAIAQFSSMLREHPNIVKTKFPVLANFVSMMTTMTRRDLKEEMRIQKVELVLNSVITLASHMKEDEFSSLDTALTNCFEFYEKHIEEGILHIKDQISFSELLIKACAAYLNRNTVDARTLLRDNRAVVERVCKRCRDRYDAELILDTLLQPVS